MSLGGKYVFATLMCFVLPMCIFTSCSSVVCVLISLGIFMFMNVMSSLMSVVFTVCAYDSVVRYFLCVFYLCMLCFLFSDDVWFHVVCEMPFILI